MNSEKFWSRVTKTEDCWLWTGSKWSTGYGRFPIRGVYVGAHRIAWMLRNGGELPALCVLHHCDVPLCVNPDHLFLGTHADNINDRDAKGRTTQGDSHWTRLHPEKVVRGDIHWTKKRPPTGEENGRAKLNGASVIEIRRLRASGVSAEVLAARFRMDRSSIFRILGGTRWKHVTEDSVSVSLL